MKQGEGRRRRRRREKKYVKGLSIQVIQMFTKCTANTMHLEPMVT
jgi:hypothetical protein